MYALSYCVSYCANLYSDSTFYLFSGGCMYTYECYYVIKISDDECVFLIEFYECIYFVASVKHIINIFERAMLSSNYVVSPKCQI